MCRSHKRITRSHIAAEGRLDEPHARRNRYSDWNSHAVVSRTYDTLGRISKIDGNRVKGRFGMRVLAVQRLRPP